MGQLAAETRRRGIELDALTAITDAVTFDGSGTPGARAYQASAGFHPALVFDEELWAAGTWKVSADLGKTQWTPTALRFLELVVLKYSVAWTQIQHCGGYVYAISRLPAPGVTRFRAYQTVRVFSALDGKLVAKKTFTGKDPRLCAATEPSPSLYGAEPVITAAVPWLESLIHPPAP